MPLLEVDGVTKTYARRGQSPVVVLDDVKLNVESRECAGLVGESGSGKTTLIGCITGLVKPDTGTIVYDGIDMLGASHAQRRRFREEIQLVFQDPFASLDPRMTIEQIVGEGLVIQKKLDRSERRDAVVEALGFVGLDSAALSRRPAGMSGGQRQRVAIARAIVVRPRLLICDEPVSALDVSVQAQVINLLSDMRRDLDLTMLFVAHDLAVVRHLCDTVSILCEGRFVEEGPCSRVFADPQAEYTRELLGAVDIPDPSLRGR